ncbi:thermonuclease family protein [Alphaproteobacteria bacterium]|nr:thermonuclease family protein [Alphaproteobacteria bacterium]
MIKSLNHIVIIFIYFMSFSLANCKSLDNSIRIIDGDTIILNSEKIRFYGIDTPEKKQKCKDRNGLSYPCGEFATNELKKIISSGQLFCKKRATDRYGRSISICYVNGVDINSLMVKNGWALAYRKYSRDYIDEEKEAKDKKMGMWAGKFIAPWRWRKLKR